MRCTSLEINIYVCPVMHEADMNMLEYTYMTQPNDQGHIMYTWYSKNDMTRCHSMDA